MRIAAALIVSLFMWSCGSPSGSVRAADSSLMDSAANDTAAHDTIAAVPLQLKDSAFVPKHYRVADVVFGDLNRDSFPDAIVMLRHDSDDVAMYSEDPRWIYILLGTADGNFEVKSKSSHATFKQSEGGMFGDPYDGMTIGAGTFSINHYGGSRYRWTSNYVFEYDAAKTEWYYTRHYSSWMDMLMEDTTVHTDSLVLKNKIAFSTFNHETAPNSSAGD